MAHNKYTKWHGGRALLNRVGQQSTAAIVAEIEDTSSWKGTAGRYETPSYTLQIANCDRSVAFEVEVCRMDYEFENSLEKIDTMIEKLLAFRDGMVIERNRWLERCNKNGWPLDPTQIGEH